MNTMKRLKTKYDSVNKAMGIGQTTKPPTEPKIDKAWSVAREALEKAERAVHDATSTLGLSAAKRAMAKAQLAFTKVYKAHEKGTR